jgi:excisionase family DNA binding protein
MKRDESRADDVRRSRLPGLPAHLVPITVERVRPPRPLTRKQAANALGVHPRTVDRWVRRGRLRAVDLGGTVRIPAAETSRVQLILPWTRFD